MVHKMRRPRNGKDIEMRSSRDIVDPSAKEGRDLFINISSYKVPPCQLVHESQAQIGPRPIAGPLPISRPRRRKQAEQARVKTITVQTHDAQSRPRPNPHLLRVAVMLGRAIWTFKGLRDGEIDVRRYLESLDFMDGFEEGDGQGSGAVERAHDVQVVMAESTGNSRRWELAQAYGCL
ncbi:hypothetical protein M422DRAFT_269410 [Sphaerobolus stellatus SS14]|uniref:Uncharacterized protein n=1 Tax=Sphaerobolus stellatus (strain SS14) TaxID=990650 RepID=A0A0C9UK12_SPHS4|nr:hypothetical protein M422DRAFT_269410 [Sphaerobolus stellatus SS14]